MAFSDWSTTAASNGSTLGVDIAENCATGNVNDAIRKLMADMRSAVTADLNNFLAGLAGLPIANGGTGATSASAALTALGALSSSYRDLPLVTKTSAFTFADSERGGRVNYTGSAAAATINPNATTAITDGAVYVIRNNGSGTLTITRGSGVSLKANNSTTSADYAMAVGAVATLIRFGTDDWIIKG